MLAHVAPRTEEPEVIQTVVASSRQVFGMMHMRVKQEVFVECETPDLVRFASKVSTGAPATGALAFSSGSYESYRSSSFPIWRVAYVLPIIRLHFGFPYHFVVAGWVVVWERLLLRTWESAGFPLTNAALRWSSWRPGINRYRSFRSSGSWPGELPNKPWNNEHDGQKKQAGAFGCHRFDCRLS